MRLLFGDKVAYHIADSDTDPASRRAWLQKTVRKFIQRVNALDTTPGHKTRMMTDLEAMAASLKGARKPSWDLIYSLLRLCMHLLGFETASGVVPHTVVYWQTPLQHYRTNPPSPDGSIARNIRDRQDAISVRTAIVQDLKSKGLDDFKIAVVLNTSEYEVKRLRSNFAVQRTAGSHRSPRGR